MEKKTARGNKIRRSYLLSDSPLKLIRNYKSLQPRMQMRAQGSKARVNGALRDKIQYLTRPSKKVSSAKSPLMTKPCSIQIVHKIKITARQLLKVRMKILEAGRSATTTQIKIMTLS